jgi:hypothetical protein
MSGMSRIIGSPIVSGNRHKHDYNSLKFNKILLSYYRENILAAVFGAI